MRQPPAQERALALGVLQPPSPTSPRLEDEAVWRSPRSSLPAGPVISLSVRSSRFAAGWSPTFPIRHSGPFSPARSGRLRSRQTVRNWANATVAKRGTPTAPGNFRTYRSPRSRSSTTGAPAQGREHGLLVHLELTTPGVAVRRSNRSAGSTLRVTLAGTSAKPVMTAPTGSSATSVSSPT